MQLRRPVGVAGPLRGRVAGRVAWLVAGALAGCTAADPVTPAAALAPGAGLTGAAPVCSPADLPTLTAGTLTVSTGVPARSPWVVGDDPARGEGFEVAVAYAVAAQLGYSHERVTWVRTSVADALATGPQSFDVDLDQVSITEDRKAGVDFSSPYYDVAQAVLTTAGSPASAVTTSTGLRRLHLGAQQGTTSWTALTDVVGPAVPPTPFATADSAVAALAAGEVQAVVLDLPAAFTAAAERLPGGVVVGQLERGGDGGTQAFGMVLAEGSPLTACVSRAVDALRADGTLDRLERQWLVEHAQVPVLR